MADLPETPGAAPEEAAEQADEGAEKKPRSRQGCLARMTPVTTPGCASCLTAVFLVTTVVTVWLVFFLDPVNIPWRDSMTVVRVATVLLLIGLIPWSLHKTLRLWLEGEATPFPDLDYAWRAGLHALATNGIALDSTPLYLILGSANETQERALLAASGAKMRVVGVPEGPAPLHWYASPDGIYLFCSDACWTSAIASLREELAAEAAAKGLPPDSPSLPPIPTDEIDAYAHEAAASPAPYAPAPPAPEPFGMTSPPPSPRGAAGGDGVRGTMMLDQFLADQQLSPDYLRRPPAPTSAPAAPADQPYRGTLMLGAPGSDTANELRPPSWSQAAPPAPRPERPPPRASAAAPSEPLPSSREPVVVAPQYATACLQELNYLGNLLRRVRQPVCGLNGVLLMIQFESIHAMPVELDELQKAIRADLSTLEYAVQMRAPVTALLVGLEKERGFRELVRRVGQDRAMAQRFGRKFEVRSFPTADEMASLSAHVCGAFEDWAYTLFREEESLTRPGNTRLYELLSKVRCSWKTRLAEILAGGFGCESEPAGKKSSLLFSGCYLAATGETPDRQAFVKGVFDKLREEQELVEWSEDAVSINRWQGRAATWGMFATLALIASLAGMHLWRTFR